MGTAGSIPSTVRGLRTLSGVEGLGSFWGGVGFRVWGSFGFW